ncbi:esterase/lipase family protein [Nocardia transvalensis]|uniref:esterase/lipase family protein n=1 Tax=Nocardia transvalensis TaxID=37333 RepID=UPI0018935268|nr:alpha/beta fold hydrolase [Nocardia transvalensis]MBF6327835.1 lipase [Nocardia transvalensis]
MRRGIRRRLSSAAVAVGVAVLAANAGIVGANAAPAPAASTQQLVDRIASGVRNPAATPIADTGSAGGGSTAADTVGYGPAQSAWLAALGYSLLHPAAAPPGSNDWGCRPSAAHPEPVVLVHGTWENAYDDFAYMSQPIHDAGYCVFTFNYGVANLLQGGGLGPILPGRNGTGDIRDSSKQLAAFVDRVLDATGARKVNIVAHSQAGPMSRWYLKFDGGADKVDHEITFAGTNHGTTLVGIAWLGRLITNLGIDVVDPAGLFVGRSSAQQTVGSDFVNQLNAGGDTVPGVDYTVVGTRYDQVSTPFDLTFLRPGPGATVRNITLQDGCEQDLSDHLSIMYSPRSLSIVLNTLDPAQTPQFVCTFNPWLFGGGGRL